MSTKNYKLSAVSSDLEYGKGGGIIKFSDGSFKLVDHEQKLLPLEVAVGVGDNAVATQKGISDLNDRVVEIETGSISQQVVPWDGEGGIGLTDFPTERTIINDTDSGNLKVIFNDSGTPVVATIYNQFQTDFLYWKYQGINGANAKTIYVQEEDPTLSGTVAEGSIWFRI